MTIRRSTLIAVLLWTAAWPSLAAEQAPAPPAPQAKIDPAAAAVSPLAARPLDRFSVTRNRPLFSPTRRPPAPPPAAAAAPPAPPPPPPDVVLLGVVVDGEDAHAVVRTGGDAQIRRVRIGDEIGGWKVGQIEARKLVLLLNGRMATFVMFSGKEVKRWPNTTAALPNAHRPAPRQAAPVIPPSRRRSPPPRLRTN
jgi:general secretion pathway protein N